MLYTWDYCALKTTPRTTVSQELVNLGFLEAKEINLLKDRFGYGTKQSTQYILTPKGQDYINEVEINWLYEIEGMEFWSFNSTVGKLTIGTPGLHPTEVESDLRKYFGMNWEFRYPDWDDQDLATLIPDFRPWERDTTWLDCSEEGWPVMKGAYMRIWGEPHAGTAVAMYECFGQEPQYASHITKTICQLKTQPKI